MSKRTSEYQLTKDNYNNDDDDDDDHCPSSSSIDVEKQTATQEVLKNRVLIKAKRRNLDSSSSLATSNVFSGFKGFTSFGGDTKSSSSNFTFNFGTTTTTAADSSAAAAATTTITQSDTKNSTFSFGSKDGLGTKQNGNNMSTIPLTTKSSAEMKMTATTGTDSNSNSGGSNGHHDNDDDKKSEIFLANLNKLNESFVEHISQYTSNPKSIYDFTLVCEEYIAKCKKLREMSSSSSLLESDTKRQTSAENTEKDNKNVGIKKDDNNQKMVSDEKLDSQSTMKSSSFTIPSLSSSSQSSAATTLTKKSNQNSELFSFGIKADNSSAKDDNDGKQSGGNNTGFSSLKFDSIKTFGNKNDGDQQPKLSFPTTFPNPISTSFPSFGDSNVKKVEDSNTETTGDDGDGEQPPKVQSFEHNEEDAVYTKKCKLYYKKNDNFVEKGLGFLYIKTVKNTEDDDDGSSGGSKSQLLIRADTNMGTILLNIALIDSLPISKADKGKGVLITCVPNPPLLEMINNKKKKKNNDNNDSVDDADVDKQTVTFLIRVKQTDCDELYDNLMKYKKT